LQSFGSSSKHAEIGSESFGIFVCRFVGTVPDILALVWPSFRPKAGSKWKISGRILKNSRGPFGSVVKVISVDMKSFVWGLQAGGRLDGIQPTSKKQHSRPKHSKGCRLVCWPNVFWEAWGTKAIKPHIEGDKAEKPLVSGKCVVF
jgi:hypothetical protein